MMILVKSGYVTVDNKYINDHIWFLSGNVKKVVCSLFLGRGITYFVKTIEQLSINAFDKP